MVSARDQSATPKDAAVIVGLLAKRTGTLNMGGSAGEQETERGRQLPAASHRWLEEDYGLALQFTVAPDSRSPLIMP